MTTMTTDVADADLIAALRSDQFIADPYPTFAMLRERPGWKSPAGYRVFSSYDDVLQILRQPDLFGQERVPYPNFHTTDPPEHTRIRRLAAKAFTAQSVGLLRNRITEIVTGIIDDLDGRTEADLLPDVALRMTAEVTAEILNVPASDATMWHGWMWELARYRGITSFFTMDDIGALDAAKGAAAAMAAYMQDLTADKSQRRADGIVARLFDAREADDSLSEEEILYTLVLLLGAGLHTTSGQLGNTMRAILTRPDVHQKLLADPDLIQNTVEEVLRIDGTLQAEYRTMREDTVLAGVPLSLGEHIIVVNAAANHDPEMFPDPERFDPERENARKHLTFGFGIHHCLGAELARTELNEATRQLLARLPGLRLNGEIVQSPYHRWRGITSLPVTWDAA